MCSSAVMAFPNDASFTCTWKIKNFSNVALLVSGVKSQRFEINAGHTDEMEYVLHLKLTSGETEFYQLSLEQCNSKSMPQGEWELSFVASDGSSIRYHKILYADKGPCVRDICAAHDIPKYRIYDKADIFYPQDTLTVRCRIWQPGMLPDECFIYTSLCRESYVWNIEKFSKVKEVTRKTFQLASFQFEVEVHRDSLKRKTIIKTFILRGNFCGSCKLSMKFANVTLKDSNIHFTCLSWKDFTDISNILNEKCLSNDTLPLKWEFTAPVDENTSEVALSVPTPITPTTTTVSYIETIRLQPNTLQEYMLRLYQDEKFSDTTLSSGGVSFAVHKSILCTRSPVFCAMFEGDTMESQTGLVPIPDIEPDTLEQLLIYLYTDVLGRIRWKEASKLYYAADKYDVPTLKGKCLSVLKSELSADNACDLAVLADTHQDHGLMRFVVEFIQDHDEVICSNEWKALEENNPRLTTKVFREMHLNKN